MQYFRSGNTLLVVVEGTTFQKTFTNGEEVEDVLDELIDLGEDADLVDVAAAFSYSAESEVKAFLDQKQRIVEERSIIDLMDEISKNGHEFIYVKDRKVYAKGIDIAMPEVMVREFVKRADSVEDTTALIKFWSLACLNPSADTRDRLFQFCDTHGITLTDKGYLVVYRNAVYKTRKYETRTESGLESFVRDNYTTIKAMKKGPGNYFVHSIYGEYHVNKEESDSLGNLKDLFLKLQTDYLSVEESEEVYTDQYSRTTTIKIGQPVALDESMIDTSPDNECSRGLHVAGEKWLSQNYFGEVGLVCLVNPMNVRAIPYADRGKMRVKEYMPIGKAVYDDNGRIVPVDVKTFQHVYESITANEVLDMLKNLIVKECLDTYNIPTDVNSATLKTIFSNIADVTPEDLKGRTDGRVRSVNG